MHRVIDGLLGSLLLAMYLAPQACAARGSLDGLDTYIESVRRDWQNVGLAVAVVSGDEVIYAKGFGHRVATNPALVTANTLFQIGSTTKAFTAAALGILVDEGKIRWDDKVIKYLPGFQLQDPWLTRQLTVRDLISHRSGIFEDFYFCLTPMTQEAAIEQLRYVAADGELRDSFRYSNLMVAVAGRVIEVASGMTWQQFVQRRLLDPLTMTRTKTSPYEVWDRAYVAPTFLGSSSEPLIDASRARIDDIAMPHARAEDGSIVMIPWRSYDDAAPAGALVSSVSDMAKWLILNLNGGQFEGRQILESSTVRELQATQNLHVTPAQFPFLDGSETYAMGWRRARYLGHVHLAHSGGIIGFPAYVALLPDAKIGVVILANGPKSVRDEYTLHKAIVFSIFDRLLGAPKRDWRAEFKARARAVQERADSEERTLQAERLPGAPPSLPLTRYAGTYEDLARHSGAVIVAESAGRLRLRFAGEGAFSGDLEPWHHEVFRLRATPGLADRLGPRFAAFSIGKSGTIESMRFLDASFTRRSTSLTEHLQ
jgi:CubicO group peptidase (beta-lactamase class C family)